MNLFLFLSIFFGAFPSVKAPTDPSEPISQPYEFRLGSQLEGIRPGDPVIGWEPYDVYDSVQEPSVYVLRKAIDLPERDNILGNFTLEITMLGSYEVYWDGLLIGENGSWGSNKAQERPGYLTRRFILPQQLVTPGKHILAFRVSTHYRESQSAGTLFFVALRPFPQVQQIDWSQIGRLVALGFCAPVSLFFFLIWLRVDRRWPMLIFASLCLAVSALLIAEGWRDMFNYLYPMHYVRLRLVLGLTLTVVSLLILFLVIRFEVANPLFWWGLALLMILATPFLSHTFDGRSAWMMGWGLAISLLITLWALWQRKPGSGLTLVGVGLCFTTMQLAPFDFLDHLFFSTFCVLIFCFLISLIQDMRARRQAHQRAQLIAARLEIEMLKKHIQPHFLMNTLTSLMEWLEEDPKTAVRMVQALAEEFEVLNRISGETQIPMRTELALCHAHLEVMGLRKDCHYQLKTEGLDLDAPIPPAIFHTLIENGITHAAVSPGQIAFLLEGDISQETIRYCLRTPLAPGWKPKNAVKDGTGLAYVKMRLQESFPNLWQLEQKPIPGFWETIISIRRGAPI